MIRHYCKIVKGNFVWSDRNEMRFCNAIQSLEGKEVEIEIRERQHHASDSQYGYFRKVIVGTCLKTEMFGGWSEDEIINHFTDNFLRTVKFKQAGTKTLGISSTRRIENLSKPDMSKFIDDVLNWLAIEGITVDTPEQYYSNR